MKLIKYELAGRGFYGYDFVDIYGQKCSIQESSLADEYAIWFGEHENRMHLNQEAVKKLLPLLVHFCEKGKLPKNRGKYPKEKL